MTTMTDNEAKAFDDGNEVFDDTDPSRQRVTREQATQEATRLLRARLNGVLGTVARRDAGAPFGSVVPYALDASGAPLIYVAGIAEHTKNMNADPRVSLLVHDEVGSREDIQTKARLCVMGLAGPVEAEELEDGWARYRARVPAAEGYRRTHDFALLRIEPTRMRWIGGFGEIFWLSTADFVVRPMGDPLRASADDIIAHMNEDHLDAARDFFIDQRGLAPDDVRMVGVDQFGMDFEAGSGERVRVDFGPPAGPDTVRVRVIEALTAARERLRAR